MEFDETEKLQFNRNGGLVEWGGAEGGGEGVSLHRPTALIDNRTTWLIHHCNTLICEDSFRVRSFRCLGDAPDAWGCSRATSPPSHFDRLT